MTSIQPKWRVDVVRHAHAGDRSSWSGFDDSQRPLTKKGRDQAKALVGLLTVGSGSLVISSPAIRCVQTVEPLAIGLGVDVVIDHCCAEGQPHTGLLKRAVSVGSDLVACTHGDVIGGLVYTLMESGLVPLDAAARKASTWRLECTEGTVISARYIPPPS